MLDGMYIQDKLKFVEVEKLFRREELQILYRYFVSLKLHPLVSYLI